MAWRGCLVMLVAVCLVTRLRLVTAQNDPIDSGENDRPPCGQPPGIENGSYEAYNHGASVSYSCDEGYHIYMFGSRERHCREDGRWDGSTPVCSAGGCSEEDAPVVPFSSVNRYNGGTVRWHRCHAGFEPQDPGSTVTYCDGTRWRNQLSRCVRAVTCGEAPRIENAQVTQGAGGLVTYTCHEGYKARLGVKNIRCGADGQWIGSPPVCIRQGCRVPRTTAVQNGIINIKHLGAMLKIECQSGYEIRGSSVLFCNGRVWNGTLPTCQLQSGGYPALVLKGDRCGAGAPRVENAYNPVYVNKYDDASRNFFYAITYRCHYGFTLHPANYAVYCSAGNVVGTLPNCLSTCGHQNGGCQQICRNGDHGAICSCRDGYKLASDGKTCQDFDECSTNVGKRPCQHICYNSPGSFVCYCHSGYNLAPNKTSCIQNQGRCNCGEHGKCVHAWGVAERCRCIAGYEASTDGFRCLAPQCDCGSGSTGCKEIDGLKKCTCAPGYRTSSNGTECNDIDECRESGDGLADCEAACRNTVGSYYCLCPQEWLRLAADKRTCEEKPCSCGAGTDTCSQPDGQKICTCLQGYRPAEDGTSCVDIDECQESGNRSLADCQEACYNTPGSYRCSCPPRWLRLAADGRSCEEMPCSCGRYSTSCSQPDGVKICTCADGYKPAPNGASCVDIDECQESGNSLADCQAACYNTQGSYRCSCPQRWLRLAADGRSCEEIPCSCGRYSTSCSQPNGVKICTCAGGYKPAPNGASCVDRNECVESNPCQGQCTNTWGSYNCRCTASGYRLAADRHSCEDIDECQNSRSHDCQHACVNVPGTYRCDCPPGNILMPDGRSCQECRPNSYRSATANECLECPAHSRTIGRGKASIRDCLCSPGYAGDYTRDTPCKDIDECEQDNGGCKQHCINTPGSFYCACPNGYMLMDDGKTCQDRDECSQSNGGCQHQCFNTEGSFVCDCNDGYTVDPSDPYLCAAVTCSPLVLSENMKVSPRDRCLGTHATNQLIVGTTCRLGCKNGYELQGNARKTCQNTGRWSGEPVACNPVRCPALQHPDHGLVNPPSCLQDGEIEFRGICAYSCDEGYTLVGSSLTNCQASGEWSNEKPSCSEVSEITCPRDVSVVLEPGESHAVVDLPKPVHTLDRLESSVPAVGHPFPAGRTAVTYTAWSNSTESLATCSFTVIVTDEEPPVFEFCPESFTVNTQEQYPEIEWEPPVATDNVAVVGNNTWISPEGRFTWGTYTVLTDVRDAAGNSATCKFSISIQTVECGKPNGPLNGNSGCSDWMFGKICEPRCNQSYYFFDGPPENVYLCGFNGEWSPSREVPDCSPYSYLGNQTTCPTGTELKSFTALEDPVCIACPRGMYYSAAAGSMPSCLPCATGTYQGGFGQESCMSCPAGQTTATEAAISSSECFLIEDVTTVATTTTATAGNTTTTQLAGPVPLNEDGVN
ncbi:fibrillin-2-like isoform X2 [Patiria miniata]|uniref:Uncharacterized protein n=1 Tax=Patiria miniata TaxID=46514 RepID=A0A914A207_PATMI|nr:fibrillin-2-like isoform X2 [Patiria miniata]